MQLWNFVRPFKFRGHDYAVKVSLTFSKTTSCLYWEDKPVDEQSMNHKDGSTTFVHPLKTVTGSEAHVESGYISWWSNIGIAVVEDKQVIYESHPGKDVRYGEKLLKQMVVNNPDIKNTQKDKWETNKYSVYADLALGALFFIAGKITGDLTLAAMLGVAGGLSLILLQRFVKVDLLGGFAVFGTIMLLISGIFSLFLQDDYWVQMKGTVLGLLTASVFFLDGVLRKGTYFGARMERYMPVKLHHNRLAIGVSLTGVFNALGNYLVAENFSQDFWLTYTTFLDTPLLVILMLLVLRWSRKT